MAVKNMFKVCSIRASQRPTFLTITFLNYFLACRFAGESYRVAKLGQRSAGKVKTGREQALQQHFSWGHELVESGCDVHPAAAPTVFARLTPTQHNDAQQHYEVGRWLAGSSVWREL